MMRRRSRLISLVATTALVLSLLPVGPASGAVAGSEVPAKQTMVTTHAGPNGNTVKVENLERDVTGIDIYRSETEGATGTKLNSTPVEGAIYRDETAEPGVQYFYTVKVASRDAAAASDKDRAKTSDVLTQVKANVKKVHERSTARQTRRDRTAKSEAEVPAKKDARAVSQGTVSAMSTTHGTPSGVTTLTGGDTWTPAGSPYFIRGDIVVPAGKTLTILPGTRIYFDTAASGAATEFPAPGVQSVTTKADLIIHGKIVAKGTATKPILFTSIRSWATSATTDGLPAEGDWGTVFTDSRDASEIDYCNFEFAKYGVWGHQTCRPYVTNSTFERYAGGPFPWAAVAFTNPWPNATTPKIKIVGNKIYGDGTDGIDVVYDAQGYNTLDRVVDAYVANNDVTCAYPIYWYADDTSKGAPHGGKYGNVLVKGTITGNTLRSNSSEAIYLDAEAKGDGTSASITTAMSNNTIVSEDDYGIYAEAYGYGVGSGADVKPTLSGDKVTAYYDAFYGYAESTDTTEQNYGYAFVRPQFTNCELRSFDDDGVYIEAYAYGKGAANTNAVFTGGKVESNEYYGVYAYAESEWGSASSSPSFTNTDINAYYGYEGIYAESYTYQAGKAQANPRFVDGTIRAPYDDGIVAYAWAMGTGSGEAKPYVKNSTIDSYDYSIDAECYGSDGETTGTGTAVVAPTVIDSTLKSYDYSPIYTYSWNGGAGLSECSPVITGSYLEGRYDGYGVEVYPYSYSGPAVAKPVLTDSRVFCSYNALYVYAWRQGSGDLWGSVIASPKLTGTTIENSRCYTSAYIEASNDGAGNATAKPTFTKSTVHNLNYDSYGAEIYAYANKRGTAEVAPVATDSTFKSGCTSMDLYAEGPGSAGHAKANGTFTNCTFSASDCEAVYAEAYDAVTLEVKPTFTECTASSLYDYGYEFYISSSGDTYTTDITVAPVIYKGSIPYSGDGVYVRGYQGTTGAAYAANVTVAPKIIRVPIVSHGDYGLYSYARTYGSGNATNNSYMYMSPMESFYGVENYVGTNTGDAFNNAKVLGASTADRARLESVDDYGVYNYARTTAGSAYNDSQSKYLDISSYSEGIYSGAYASSSLGTEEAVNRSVVIGNAMNPLWGLDGDGVYVYSDAGNVADLVAQPTITGNTITGAQGDGISVEISGAGGDEIMKPTIMSNTILAPQDDGIDVYSSNPSAGSFPVIAKNVITRPYYSGIYVNTTDGYVGKNKVVSPGWGTSTTDEWASGIYWDGAAQWNARVQCNLVTGARGSAIYYVNGAAKTNYNSFADCAGAANRPFVIWYDDAIAPLVPYDARLNWWGTTNATSIGSLVNTPNFAGVKSTMVNTTEPLGSCQPKVVGLWATPAGANVTFTVKFDRWMDTSVTTLKFGRVSPYATYSVTGTWLNANTFRGTRSAAGLPTGVNMYFSGARDWPGAPMWSTSKAFQL